MKKITLCLLIALPLLVACQSAKPIKIAISKASGSDSYTRYAEWLKEVDSEIEIVDLSTIQLSDTSKMLNGVSGLVLSGGADVHPGRYGRLSDTARSEMTLERDTMEFSVIRQAMEKQLPIFAICRGEQILNVALGGTLIVDIPNDRPSEIPHQCKDKFELCHEVRLVKESYLTEIAEGIAEDQVTSSHHQAVEKLGEGLVANAFSNDGLIEGFEWKSPHQKPFMMAVQWHPERLEKPNLSNNIAIEFFKAVRSYYNSTYSIAK